MGTWKSVARMVTYPILHPANTINSTLKVGTRAAVAGGAGYVGWEMLTTDKSAVRVVSEALVGEQATDTASRAISGAADLLEDGSERLDQATAALQSTSQGLNGVTNFISNLSGGNGGNMFSNFFSNLTSGKVSGLGIFGLVGAAMLVFGRTGWFGKIAGALLAMLVIGGNAEKQGQQKQMGQPYSRASVYSPDNDPNKVFVKAWDQNGKEMPAIQMSLQRYQELTAQKLTPIQIYQQFSGNILAQGNGEEVARSGGMSR